MPLILKTECIEPENWKDIQGYEGHYQVSNYGRIKSLKRGKEKVMRVPNDSDGYKVITLCFNNSKITHKIHRLVGLAFIPNPGNLPTINHLKGHKYDNRFFMLEWASARENTSHSFKGKNTSSKFTGVCWSKRDSKWSATAHIDGKQKHLGYFPSEIEASNAYKQALIENKIINKYN